MPHHECAHPRGGLSRLEAALRARAPALRLAAAPRLATSGLLAVAVGVAIAGCGKTSSEQPSAGVETIVVHTGAAGTAATATRNTTRLGGAGAVTDAAAVARAAYPGLTADTRPQAVAIADVNDWPEALVASALASAPLGAPLLYAEGRSLPRASELALREMHPTGASALGGAQLLLLGSSIEAPAGYRARGTVPADAYSLAVSVAKLLSIARGTSPRQAIVVAADGPPALAMPAAGLAAQSGAPILLVSSSGVPAATAAELSSLGRPSIYTVGSTAIGERTLAELGRFGPVTRAEAHAGEDATPAGNAIAVARFADGSFGWGVREPGHGLAFANATRPFDAPAAAILSATGDYAPLLLLDDATGVPRVLSAYLNDVRPASPHSQPVKGVYNHGWLIGDERAISASTQAELDAALEILPNAPPSEESSSLPVE
ncbi:MAG TPA: cell wall-binding repeat-containing protein [Solirubrobacteraceae bacterium]|nr:cell wall-binding repeat-containing protein [Solirubrobacteraceae bacterium]